MCYWFLYVNLPCMPLSSLLSLQLQLFELLCCLRNFCWWVIHNTWNLAHIWSVKCPIGAVISSALTLNNELAWSNFWICVRICSLICISWSWNIQITLLWLSTKYISRWTWIWYRCCILKLDPSVENATIISTRSTNLLSTRGSISLRYSNCLLTCCANSRWSFWLNPCITFLTTIPNCILRHKVMSLLLAYLII